MAAFTKDTEKHLQPVKHQKHWNKEYHPGDTVEFSGIYRCQECGKEITSNETDPFPPQNHHQHTSKKPIAWKLIVRTDTMGNGFQSKN